MQRMVRALSACGAVGAVGAGVALLAGVPGSWQCAGAICRRGIMVREERDCVPRGAMVHQAPFSRLASHASLIVCQVGWGLPHGRVPDAFGVPDGTLSAGLLDRRT